MGLLSAAETDLRSCLDLDRNDVEALGLLAMVLVSRGDVKLDNQQKSDYDLAIEFAERALAIKSEDWAATTSAGLARLDARAAGAICSARILLPMPRGRLRRAEEGDRVRVRARLR